MKHTLRSTGVPVPTLNFAILLDGLSPRFESGARPLTSEKHWAKLPRKRSSKRSCSATSLVGVSESWLGTPFLLTSCETCYFLQPGPSTGRRPWSMRWSPATLRALSRALLRKNPFLWEWRRKAVRSRQWSGTL